MANRRRYFATDMMRFVANKYGIGWVPQDERNELSPFTETTIAGVEFYLQFWDNNIILLHEGIAYSRWGHDFRDFVEHFFFSAGIQFGRHILDVCTGAARCATLYYKFGYIDAPNAAVEIIERTLNRFAHLYYGDIFDYFDVHCAYLSSD